MKRIILALLACGALVLGIPAAAQAIRYVALGDSVASGAGLPHVANASAEDKACDRSPQAYAYKIAKARGLTLEHLACSGAKADEGLYGIQKTDSLAVAPQLDAAFAKGTPDVITITVGANDMRWNQILRDCYTWRCGSGWDDFRLKVYKTDLSWELYRTLAEIEWRSGGTPPKVLLNGYFKPFSAAHLTCGDTRFISTKEVTWLDARANDLNATIADATTGFGFASYVPVDFTGHELCTADPWVQNRQEKAPFHPTAAGQEAIARANLALIPVRR